MNGFKLIGIVCLFGAVFLHSKMLYAQSHHFINYSVDDGLPSDEVYDIFEDSDGFLWFATDRGVARYNGYEFEIYTTQDGLHNNVIFYLYEDNQKRLWFSGLGASLTYYDLKRNTFCVIPFTAKTKSIINYDCGIFRVKSDTVELLKLHKLFVLVVDNDSLEIVQSTALVNDSVYSYFKEIWTSEKELSKIRITNLPSRDSDLFKVGLSGLEYSVPIIRQRSKISSGYIELASNASLCFTGGYTFLFSGKQVAKMDDFRMIYSTLIDKQKNVWLGTIKGLSMWNKELLEFEQIKQFNGKGVTSILEDSHGGIWCTTRQAGVFYLKTPHIKHFTRQSGLHVGAVKFINSFTDGTIFCTYMGNGVVSFFKDNVLRHVQLSILDEIKLMQPIDGNYLITIQSASWVSVLNSKQQVVQSFYVRHGASYFNPNDQHFWRQRDQRYMYWKDFRLHTLDSPSNNWNYYPGETMCAIGDTVFSGGSFGFGYATAQQTWTEIPLKERGALRLNDMDAYKKQFLAAATMGKGVFIREKGKHHFLTVKEGLLNDLCNNIYVDAFADVWVGSNSGLSWIQTDTNDFGNSLIRNFTGSSGLLSNQVNDVLRTDTNEVWVATSKGISIIDLSTLDKNEVNSPVYITSFGDSKGFLPLTDAEISLPYEENVLISYVGLDYRKEGTLKYEYQLLGLDPTWYTTSNRTVRFPKMVDGRYVFQVRLKDAGTNAMLASLSFSIKTPFWKAWWFWTLIVLGISMLICMRFINLKERSQLHVKLAKVKQQALAAQMNPHFLFNTFNSIRSLIVLKEHQKAEHYLMKIAELVRDVLNNSFEQTIPMSKELSMLENYMEIEQIRSVEGFEYRIDIAEGFDTEEVFVPPSVLQPFVENAILHGIRTDKVRKCYIHISCSAENETIVIRIEDNGVGYDTSNKNVNESKHGLGISKERLALLEDLYHQKVHLSIHSSTDPKNSGTIVTLKFIKV